MMLACALWIHHAQAATPKSLRFAVPATFAFGKGEANNIRHDMGAGLVGNFFLFQVGKWNFGPGVSLLGTVPIKPGNGMVSIKPYSLISELRAVASIDLFDNGQGFAPYVTVGTQIGSLIISKSVSKIRHVDVDFLVGAMASAGISYWLQTAGFGLCYGVSLNNFALRHRIEVSLEFALDVR